MTAPRDCSHFIPLHTAELIELLCDDRVLPEADRSALRAAASLFPDERRPYSRMRQSVIDQNPALREREQHKLAGLANTVAEALRARGTGEPAATLAAQSGATVFGIAFAQWIREGETRSLPDIASDVLHELVNLTGTAAGSPKLPSAPDGPEAMARVTLGPWIRRMGRTRKQVSGTSGSAGRGCGHRRRSPPSA